MQVTIRQFVKDLKQGLQQSAMNESVKMGKGQCKDFAEYRKQTGIIVGYDRACVIADRMLSQLEEADQDQDLPVMEETL